MSKLIIIMGATASGKDTVLNKMVKEGAKRFVSYTTRPMRIGEIYGKEYNFVTKEEFDNDIEYHLPKYLVNHQYYKNLYDKKHREFVKVITGLENSKDVDEDKLNKYKYWLKELNKYES